MPVAALTLSLAVVAVAALVVLALVWMTGLGRDLAAYARGEEEGDERPSREGEGP